MHASWNNSLGEWTLSAKDSTIRNTHEFAQLASLFSVILQWPPIWIAHFHRLNMLFLKAWYRKNLAQLYIRIAFRVHIFESCHSFNDPLSILSLLVFHRITKDLAHDVLSFSLVRFDQVHIANLCANLQSHLFVLFVKIIDSSLFPLSVSGYTLTHNTLLFLRKMANAYLLIFPAFSF